MQEAVGRGCYRGHQILSLPWDPHCAGLSLHRAHRSAHQALPGDLLALKERRELAVVQQIPTHEKLGIAFAKTNAGLCAAVNKSLASIKERGQFDALRRKWLDETQKG